MESIRNPHDKFFKRMLSRRESAIDFLQHYLPPEVSGLLDLSTLMPFKETFVDEEFLEYFSDSLFRVEFQEQGSLFVYVLFEHKSYPDYMVSYQLLRYMVRIWENFGPKDKEPLLPIFPLVFYHGEAAWKVGRHFQDLFTLPAAVKSYVPDFCYSLCDLSHYSDKDLKGNVMLQVGLLILKYVFRDELAEKLPEIFKLLRHLTHKKTGLEYLETLLRYLASASTKLSRQDLQTAVTAAISEGGKQIMPTLAQEWIEEGEERGLKKGEILGLKKGEVLGLKKGIRQGLLEAIEFGLDMKFNVRGLMEFSRINKIQDIVLLRAIRNAIKSVNTIEEFKQIYQEYIAETGNQSDRLN